MRQFLISGTLALLMLCSCQKEDETNEYKGTAVQMYSGKAWTTLRMKDKNVPDQLTISIDDAALASLPQGPGHDDHSENLFVLPLPQHSAVTPFKTVMLDWAPEGHDPANVYTVPHFDFHFYMVSQAEVEGTTDMAKMNIDPAAEYLPQNYVGANPVPQMGKHWVDITSPELNPTNPQPFTQTFIYGTYNGKVTFYEPMITLEFLKTTQNFERPIPQPQRFQQAGFYPTKMKVQKHNGVTDVTLTGFVFRNAS